MTYRDDDDYDDETVTSNNGQRPPTSIMRRVRDIVPTVRSRTRTAEHEDEVHVPEVLSPRVSENLMPAMEQTPQPIPYQPLSWGDVRRVGRYKQAMAHYSEALGHAATASGHAVKIAKNAVEVKKLSLDLWEYGEGVLTKVEQHRLERDRIKQERFVLSQTEGAQVAIALESLGAEMKRIGYQKIEDEADHHGRMNGKREAEAEHDARMKMHGVEVDYTIRKRRMQMNSIGQEGVVESDAKRLAIAQRTVLDVAEKYVICDANHVYHAAAAIWYWGARRRGESHDAALQATVTRLVDRMQNDPINLAEASKDMKKWVHMQEEMRDEVVETRLQNDIATERSERERQRAAQTEHERLRVEAARERRRTAEVNYDTFAGDDLGDDEN